MASKINKIKKKIVILGKTGMLGSTVYEIFSQTELDVIGTDRTILNAQSASVDDIQKLLNGFDYAINCIGIIKPYIHDDNSREVQRAIEVNGLFPHKLADAAAQTQTKVIQIATDCVYDGLAGNYNENAKHNALDVYGKTKSLGEVVSDYVLNLRCSIIGKEIKGKTSLLEWFINQPSEAQVNGYLNHYWNGITTLAFTKICLGIIENDSWFSGLQHIVPGNIMSKAEMLKVFAKHFNRTDININNINASESIDRTISTVNDIQNNKLWMKAGYDRPALIQEMIKEL